MTKNEVLCEAWKLAHSCQEDAIWKALNYAYNGAAEITTEQSTARTVTSCKGPVYCSKHGGKI
jgi:hypothetical protein